MIHKSIEIRLVGLNKAMAGRPDLPVPCSRTVVSQARLMTKEADTGISYDMVPAIEFFCLFLDIFCLSDLEHIFYDMIWSHVIFNYIHVNAYAYSSWLILLYFIRIVIRHPFFWSMFCSVVVGSFPRSSPLKSSQSMQWCPKVSWWRLMRAVSDRLILSFWFLVYFDFESFDLFWFILSFFSLIPCHLFLSFGATRFFFRRKRVGQVLPGTLESTDRWAIRCVRRWCPNVKRCWDVDISNMGNFKLIWVLINADIWFQLCRCAASSIPPGPNFAVHRPFSDAARSRFGRAKAATSFDRFQTATVSRSGSRSGTGWWFPVASYCPFLLIVENWIFNSIQSSILSLDFGWSFLKSSNVNRWFADSF